MTFRAMVDRMPVDSQIYVEILAMTREEFDALPDWTEEQD
jgi:hypothetical protein